MGHGAIVKAPDGGRWRVRRRWLERPLPNVGKLWRKGKREESADGLLDASLALDALDAFWPTLALAVFVLLVIFVLLPLLGIALELIALVFVLVSGLFSRVVLRRPWIVIAEELGDPEERVAFAVKGWRDSGEALRELRTAIATAGPPERLAIGEPLATKRPSAAAGPSPRSQDSL
jgi:hypothetical protein